METKSAKTAGSLKVSEQVVAKIARLAASEVKGVALCAESGKTARGEKNFLSYNSSPVKVRFLHDAAEIDISIVTLQGCKASSTGENVQLAVKKAVQNMAGITVSKVNVKIEGIRLTEHD